MASVAAGADALPEDRGAAGLAQSLRRLGTTARVMHITAHPDDEDGGTITYLSRGLGARVVLLSLTRGESGANLITSDFFDSLGALRTLELERAAQHYGVRIRFTSFTDYGYSKNLDEARRSWDFDKLLGEVVRAVREEQPHIILSRWQGNARDGHGQHSAAGVMAQLAFEAAADPRRYPEQGLPPWQALKLYSDNRRGLDDYTVQIDSGAVDPWLGRSYAQLAREGLRWQRTQGAGAVSVQPGPQASGYKLLASRVGMAEKEASIFERIEPQVAPPAGLQPLAADIAKGFDPARPAASAPALARGLESARRAGDAALISAYQDALNRALGVGLTAYVQPDQPIRGPAAQFRAWETFAMAVPGQTFQVLVSPTAGFANVAFRAPELDAPAGWSVKPQDGGRFQVTVAGTQQPRRSVALTARVRYVIDGVEAFAEAPVEVSRLDQGGLQQFRPLSVGPALSVRFATTHGILPIGRDQYEVSASVRSLGNAAASGQLRLALPSGWTSEPAAVPFRLAKEGEEHAARFRIKPAGGAATEVRLEAIAESGGREYRSGWLAHTAPGLDVAYLEKPAVHVVRRVDVKVASGLRIGYVMGTGDDVPAALNQLSVPYDLLDPQALATADLSRYTTIILGIRAYAAREDVKTHNARLLDFVNRGGVLIVQYNTPEFDNNYGPFPYTMGRNPEEISEEDSPVKILDASDPVFLTPNKITQDDFNGWVEQRGSKFLTTWDAAYKTLLETQDTGQAPQRGGWLVARHGRGLYVYCAYAWYRQLPFAVPGATRLFANLISLRPPVQ